jgi:hypothetical protein
VADEPDQPTDLSSGEADEICDVLNKAILDRLLEPLRAKSPGDLEIWLKSMGPPALEAAEVARELRKSISAVYAARHRINKSLKQLAENIREKGDPGEATD